MIELTNQPEPEIRFNDLGQADQQRMIQEHVRAFNLEASGKMADIFKYANPRLSMCDNQDQKYYVIHPQSIESLKLFSKKYLI